MSQTLNAVSEVTKSCFLPSVAFVNNIMSHIRPLHSVMCYNPSSITFWCLNPFGISTLFAPYSANSVQLRNVATFVSALRRLIITSLLTRAFRHDLVINIIKIIYSPNRVVCPRRTPLRWGCSVNPPEPPQSLGGNERSLYARALAPRSTLGAPRRRDYNLTKTKLHLCQRLVKC